LQKVGLEVKSKSNSGAVEAGGSTSGQRQADMGHRSFLFSGKLGHPPESRFRRLRTKATAVRGGRGFPRLDVGTGYGFLLQWLKQKHGITATGVELSLQEAEYAAKGWDWTFAQAAG